MLLYGKDAEVATWVAGQLGYPAEDFTPCTAIGITIDNKLVAGVVYNNYRAGGIEMTIASTTSKWCTRTALYYLFAYPFEQLGCRRVTATTARNKHTVNAFLRRLGFRHEGLMREALNGVDARIYGMLKKECKWLRRQ